MQWIVTLTKFLNLLELVNVTFLNTHLRNWFTIHFLVVRGRVDNLSFFDYLSPFCLLSIEFHSTFSISYKILPYFVYYYCILVRM